MTGSPAQRRYVVVALFEDLPTGTTFARSGWPAHLTLASNFAINVSPDDVVEAVHRADSTADPVLVEFAGRAMFGPNRDIPVQLVQSATVVGLHRRLADQLQALPGFAADEPDFWREGFRPHVTLRPSIDAVDGDRWATVGIAVAHLLGPTATISAFVAVPAEKQIRRPTLPESRS